MSIRVEIVSEDRQVYEGEADIVVVPGVNGEMGILPNHAPLISTLRFGILKVRYRGTEEVFTISGGLVEVQPTLVTVLAAAAENVREIDVARAAAAKKHAEELLNKELPSESEAYQALETAIRRSNLRLEAARRYGKSRKSQSSDYGQGR